MIGNQSILMSEIYRAHPQEWPALIPVVEYLQHTAPQGAHGFSAHDMCSAYSVLNETDARLAAFRVPTGLPESDVVSRLFANFRQVYTTFTRINREQSLANITAANKDRHVRIDEAGETVFRRMPKGFRLPKGLFPPPSSSPYTIVSQPDKHNVVLKTFHW